jgi:cellulose synthase/poly-beta-1,6-N-acetylglucosamine synthase-like glycosyltransferase
MVLLALPALAAGLPVPAGRPWYVLVLLYLLYAIITLVVIYMARHYVFTVNRLFGRQRYPYLDVDTARWPQITVLIPARNEEAVIARMLDALLAADYPEERMTILPVNDRSEDATGAIIDEYARRFPGRIRPMHRTEGRSGKGAVLRDATETITTDVILVFDADYVPGRGLIKQLVAPFFDPEVGAVMGRVVPYNVERNLLTRLLDLERAGGYQVDQQARMNMGFVPQYGGTVGGVRRRALQHVGGWNEDTLAEDTDATYRLLNGGWKTVYQNRSECYEEAPETWPARVKQVRRWARGHNESMWRYSRPLLAGRRVRAMEKLDGQLLLGVYLMSPILVLGWVVAMTLWYLGVNEPGLIVVLAVTCYSTIGNHATFFEVAAATHLDGSRERARLIPFILMGFLVTIVSVTKGTFAQAFGGNGPRDVQWHKTERNGSNGNGNGLPRGGGRPA